MLSNDELNNGVNFILKLSDATGNAANWIARLEGEMAIHWFGIYYRSDWRALREHGRDVFRTRATEADADRMLRSERCLVIHTSEVKAEEIDPLVKLAVPLQPDWESDGGSLAPLVSATPLQVAADASTAQEMALAGVAQ